MRTSLKSPVNKLRKSGTVFLLTLLLLALSTVAVLAISVGPLWYAEYQYSDGYGPYGIASDSQGNVYVITYSYETSESTIVWYSALVKYDVSGNEEWVAKTPYIADLDMFHAVAVDSKDNPVVVGSQNNSALIKKYDPAGNELWAQLYPGINGAAATDVKIDGHDNILVAGAQVGAGSAWSDMTAMKYNPNGQQRWVTVFDGDGDWYPYRYNNASWKSPKIVVDAKEDAYVGGWAEASASLTKFKGANGALVWATDTVNGVQDIAVQGEGVYALTGPGEWTVRKFAASTGELIWESNYPQENYVLALGVDSEGNAYSTGVADAKTVLVKHRAADGREEWVAEYKGPPQTTQEWWSWNLAVDRNSNRIYVSGFADDDMDREFDLATVAYDSSGTVIWSDVNHNGHYVNGEMNVMAADKTGVYVADNAWGSNGSVVSVLKYAP